MEPATRTGCEGSPSSSLPDSPPSPDTASSDDDPLPFDIMLERAGSISATLPTDARGLITCILNVVFAPESRHPSIHHRPSSDADAAELALLNYFIMLGPRRLHLLPQPSSQETKQPARAPFPSGPSERTDEGLDAAAAIPTISSEAGKEKAADLKRGSPDPSVFPSSTTNEHSPECKKPRVSSVDVAHVKEGSLDKGDPNEAHCPSRTVQVEEPPLSWAGSNASLPFKASELLVLLKKFDRASIELPCPKWWRPGGYGPFPSGENK